MGLMANMVDAVLVRRVHSPSDLVATFDAIGRQFDPIMRAPHRDLAEPIRRFDEDRTLMLAVLADDVPIGGVIAFRNDRSVIVRAIGVDVAWRERGIGRRLMELVEIEALELGSHAIALGATEDAGGFYDRLGYRGKRTMREKQLPPRGPIVDMRIERMRAELGDLEAGVRY
jgi:GNAT superfamily N-acetyltransferase